MFKIGRLCLKIAGRDAGLKCLVVEVIDDNYVLIDGQTRRRKCNIKHLEPLDKVLKVKKGLGHNDVLKELRKEGVEVKEKVKRKKKAKIGEAKTEEKPVVKETVKKQEIPKPKKEEKPKLKKEKPKKQEKPAAKPKKADKKAEAKPKKTAVKKAKPKPKAKKATKASKSSAKAKTKKK